MLSCAHGSTSVTERRSPRMNTTGARRRTSGLAAQAGVETMAVAGTAQLTWALLRTTKPVGKDPRPQPFSLSPRLQRRACVPRLDRSPHVSVGQGSQRASQEVQVQSTNAMRVSQGRVRTEPARRLGSLGGAPVPGSPRTSSPESCATGVPFPGGPSDDASDRPARRSVRALSSGRAPTKWAGDRRGTYRDPATRGAHYAPTCP